MKWHWVVTIPLYLWEFHQVEVFPVYWVRALADGTYKWGVYGSIIGGYAPTLEIAKYEVEHHHAAAEARIRESDEEWVIIGHLPLL